jgi:hypothetical protein
MELTIRIPDELALKVGEHRINVARVVESALRRQVALREPPLPCPDDFAATVAWLRPQHDERYLKAFQLGFAAGVEYAKTEATLAELEAIDRWSDPNFPHHGLPKRAHELEYAVIVKEGNGRLDGLTYLRGWHGGMLSVWLAIQDRL